MNQEAIGKLRKDIDTVMEWRKSGKALTKEQQFFADKVADEMIGARVSKQVGIQLVSKDKLEFIKGQRTDSGVGSDAVGGVTQDAVESGQAKKGKYARLSQGLADIKKAFGVKPKEVPVSAPESGVEPRKSADLTNIKLTPPENQKEGEPCCVADDPEKVTPKDEEGKPTEDVATQEIGHNPNLPMPQKVAEDLIANAKWGVEIGAYVSVKEGIERQLGRKSYAEFTDTPEKYKAVTSYLLGLVKESEPEPVA